MAEMQRSSLEEIVLQTKVKDGSVKDFFFCPEVEAISFYLLRNWVIAGISNLSLASIFKTMNISIYCKWVHTLLPNYRFIVQIIPVR